MRLLILRSSSCFIFVLLLALVATSQTRAEGLTGSNAQGEPESDSSGPAKEVGKRRLTAAEVADGLEKRATYTHGKKSLWRSASTAARSLRARFSGDDTTVRALVKRDQISDFCARFSTSCTNYCNSVGQTRRNYLCGQASSTSTTIGLNVRCRCGTTDYTANVLANQAPAPAVRVAATARVTTVRTVTSTSTVRATSSVCRTIATTSTRPGTTYSTDSTTTLPTTTQTFTSRTSILPPTGTTTVLSTIRSTVLTTTVRTGAAVTSTTTVFVTASSTTVQVVAQATARARDLDEAEEVELFQLDKRAPTFCQAYTSACSNACSTRGGSRTSRCTVSNTNSYSLSCVCNDGSSQSRRALNVAQAATSSTTTSTVTNTVTSVRLVTSVVATLRTTTTTTATVSGPMETDTYLQFVLPYTATTTTATVRPTTTFWRTITSTVRPLTTVVTTSTSTPRVVSTLTRTTTVVTTQTSTSAAPTASTNAVEGPRRIQVRDANNAGVYGLLSAYQDEDAYAFMLDETSEDGMFVSIVPATVSSTTTGLVGVKMNNTDYDPFNYVGFEVQDLSDQGVQPNPLEYLLLTDTAPMSDEIYPSTENGDTGAFPAQAFAWTFNTNTNRLFPIWTNPEGSSPATAAMQMYMLCTGSGNSDCFVSAAYNVSTWSNFDTTGVTITRVHLILV